MDKSLTLQEIAERIGGTLEGNAQEKISKVAEIEHASAGQITFCANPKYQKFIETTHASCIIIDAAASVSRRDIGIIRVADAYAAFMQVQKHFAPPAPKISAGIHPSSSVAATAKIAKSAAIGAFAVIGENVVIGENAVIHPHVTLGDGVEIGAGTVIYPHVTVYYGCKIGSNVTVHAGTVIGSDGFGFAENSGEYDKIPQLGIVVIEDEVEIGANCTIDRATIGETHIKRGCKIDNLVQIAHNVTIGENTIIVAQSGVSGSTKLGKHVILAGQAGVVGHIELADNVIVTAQSGVSKSLMKPGMYMGSPAREYHTALRSEAIQRKMPELMEELQRLKERVKEIEELLQHQESH
jgi:UDP-3-O-[3-hydroxymyristoyl] glucosamine N-acyltransferase